MINERRWPSGSLPADHVVVGVDVGGRKKGFHAVALRNGQLLGTMSTCDPLAIVQWCVALHALAVGVDAPCSWSLSGHARRCERELAAAGITAFATPSQAVGANHPFYGWMLNGAELFRLLAQHYPLFDGRSTPVRVCFETFPHAVACALAGRILSAKQKRRDRPRLLHEAGIALERLTNIDQLDAALCALAAHHLVARSARIYGDAHDGVIVVPAI